MKKILTVILAICMFACFCISAAAATGSFVSSPSANRAPTLVTFENASEDCVAEIKVSAYADRFEIGEDKAKELEAAYSSIAKTTDLGVLSPDLVALAEELGVPSEKLSVSDLFDVSAYNCESHDDHAEFTIKVKPASVKNYAGLIHYKNGEWEVVESKAEADGTITFTVDSFSPFAIVVHDGSIGADANESFIDSILSKLDLSEKELKIIAAGFLGISIFGIMIIVLRKLIQSDR